MKTISENILKLKNYDVEVKDWPGMFDLFFGLQWDVQIDSIEDYLFLINKIRSVLVRHNPEHVYFELEDLTKALRLLDFFEDLQHQLEKINPKKENAESVEG